jgi:hypothetical protein
VDFAVTGPIIEWRGPAPFYFLRASDEISGVLRELTSSHSYGWGCIPVEATFRGVTFTTSLMPKDGTYLVPMKKAVREAAGVGLGDHVVVEISLLGERGA